MNTNYNKFTSNPYTFGKSIETKARLFGREEIIGQIKDNLKNNKQITLLEVQRRIGKSSLLKCLPQYMTEDESNFQFFEFSFQGFQNYELPEILDHFAEKIIEDLSENPKELRELANSLDAFFGQFLPNIINQYLSGKKVVFLLDEFDVLGEDKKTYFQGKGKDLFDSLKKAVQRENRLFAILVFGKPAKKITYLESFLKQEKQSVIKVAELNSESTENLIREPAKDILEYQQDAIDEIWHLSAGNPSLTQLLCFFIFKDYKQKETKKVTRTDVKSILDEAMAGGNLVLSGFLEPLNENEKLFFRAIAETQERGIVDPLKIIKPTRKRPVSALMQAGKRLVEYGFLEEKDTVYKVKVELVRLWLLKNHPLYDEERLQMEQIPEQDQNLPETNNNGKMPKQEGNNNSQGPNQIEKFLSLFVVSLIIVIPLGYSFFRIRNSPESKRSRSECSRLLGEINLLLEDKIERSEVTQQLEVIEKVRGGWSIKEKSLDLQCPYDYELDKKYNELLYRYGWNQINLREFDKAIKPFCEITEEYKQFSDVKEILSRWISSDTLSMEKKKKVMEVIIEQNSSGNDCLAYSFTSERNKQQLYEQQNQLYYQEAKNYIENKEFEKAVESYCKITREYDGFDDIVKQLRGWLSNDRKSYDDERKKVREKLTQLTNNCPVSPLNN